MKDSRTISYVVTVEVREGSALRVARSHSQSINVSPGLTLERIGAEILHTITPEPPPPPKRHPG